MRCLVAAILLSVGITPSVLSQSFVFTERSGLPELFNVWDGSVTAGDIDNDGDADIVLSGRDAGDRRRLRATLYRNNGNAGFTAVENTEFVGLDLGTCTFVDMDSDGDLDLWITGRDNRPLFWAYLYINDGTGAFTLASNMPLEGTAGAARFFDVDRNGSIDVMMTGSSGPNSVAATMLYRNNGAGGFTRDNTLDIKPLTGGSIGLIDFDADGDTDVLISGKDDIDSIFTLLYENDGAGRFIEVPNTPFDGLWFHGSFGVNDVDNDGDQDVVITGETATIDVSTALYLNNGSGGFFPAENVTLPAAKWGEVQFADFDGDGSHDLLISGMVNNSLFSVELLRNTGPAAYEPAGTLVSSTMSPTFQTSCAVADFDGDAILDVLFTATFFNPLLFLTNEGTVSVSENNIDSAAKHGVQVYPNPATDVVTFRSPDEHLRHVEVFNVAGTRLFSDILNSTSPTVELSVAGYPAGLYTVVLTTERSRFARTVVVQ